MINLIGTTDKLQLISSAAANLDVLSSYVDVDTSTPPVVQGISRNAVNIPTAVTTDIVAAPGASRVRNVKQITVRNKHASVSCDVTILLDLSGTDYELHKCTLRAGECLEFIEGVGFFVLEATSTDQINVEKRLTADYTNATVTFTDITDLSCPVKAGKHYNFESHLIHVSNATTTGAQFGINGPTMTGMILSTIDTVTASVTASVHSAGAVAALDTPATAQTTGSIGQALGILSGWINPSADGTLVIRGRSEVAVASGLIVKAGSWLHVWEADN